MPSRRSCGRLTRRLEKLSEARVEGPSTNPPTLTAPRVLFEPVMDALSSHEIKKLLILNYLHLLAYFLGKMIKISLLF